MHITKVIGFDPASFRNVGWSIVDISEDKSEIKSITIQAGTHVLPKTEEPWQVLWPLNDLIDEFLEQNSPDMIVIEKTSSFSGSFITGQVSNCIGSILAAVGKHGIPVVFVYPTHVKKVLVGKGKATKSQMKKAVNKMVSDITNAIPKYDSEHAYDAVGNVLCWLIEQNFIEGPELEGA